MLIFSSQDFKFTSNYISHKTITFNNKGRLWINEKAKQLILQKNEIYKIY